jgi:hypothetical protein
MEGVLPDRFVMVSARVRVIADPTRSSVGIVALVLVAALRQFVLSGGITL